MVRLSLVLFPADSDQVHNLPKNRPIDRIDLNRLRKNEICQVYRARKDRKSGCGLN